MTVCRMSQDFVSGLCIGPTPGTGHRRIAVDATRPSQHADSDSTIDHGQVRSLNPRCQHVEVRVTQAHPPGTSEPESPSCTGVVNPQQSVASVVPNAHFPGSTSLPLARATGADTGRPRGPIGCLPPWSHSDGGRAHEASPTRSPPDAQNACEPPAGRASKPPRRGVRDQSPIGTQKGADTIA
jgi:hypothetical protein